MKLRHKVPGAVVAIVAVIVSGAAFWTLGRNTAGATVEWSNAPVIEAVEEIGQVALLALPTRDVMIMKSGSELWGVRVPGADRTAVLRFEYTAKLGVDAVEIVETTPPVPTMGASPGATGDSGPTADQPHRFHITVPEFVFIGHSGVEVEAVFTSEGPLSDIATDDIDTTAAVSAILDDEAQVALLEKFDAELRDSARSFYTALVRSIVPDAELTFDFGDAQ